MSSPGGEHRAARPREDRLDRHLPRAFGAGNQGLRAMADERRHAVRRRRCIADVSAKARPVLDLHASNELRGLGNGRITGRNGRMPGDRGRRRRRTDRHAAVGQHRDRRHLGNMLQVDDARGPAPPLAQLRHEVGATGERARIVRAHRHDGLPDGFGPLIDEVLQ